MKEILQRNEIFMLQLTLLLCLTMGNKERKRKMTLFKFPKAIFNNSNSNSTKSGSLKSAFNAARERLNDYILMRRVDKN